MTTVTFQITSNPRNRSHDIVEEICARGINCADVRWVHTQCTEPRCPISEWATTNRVYTVEIGVRNSQEQ